jgi:integrase/recombinase XerD
MKYEIIQKYSDYLNAQGVENLLKATSDDPLAKFLMVKLTWQCGLRMSEVLNLRVEDINFENKKIKIVQPKGNKDKYVPITTGLIMEIRYYLMGQNIEAGYIFSQERSKLLQESTLRVQINC